MAVFKSLNHAVAEQFVVAIGRRLAELTGGIVSKVTQAKRLAGWLYDRLADAEMLGDGLRDALDPRHR
jgi:hypothetical protein